MVIAKLQGGLGNQMFQYAAARAVAGNKAIYLDLSFLDTNSASDAQFTARTFELAVFQHIKTKFIGAVLSRIISRDNKHPVYRLMKKALLPRLKVVTDSADPDTFSNNFNLYFDGYFQSENYFKPVRNSLLREFTFPPLTGAAADWEQSIEQSKNPVSIHVRRGDYLKPAVMAYHGVLPVAYYQKAINTIAEKTHEAEYFIFSDDINWCREHLPLESHRVKFVTSCSAAWQDMALMSRCRHHIIANSSFSWWGAWLSTNPGKVVIAPKQWFAQPELNNKAASIIPADWIKI